ncbi:hypothetical protein EYZ11_006898 [Aspergillus tanneri]|uniref:DUF7029 domain-containing protein n=1 Tax=Aspergillus tanneri TaxID=1220188 RepID=A0A4V3UP50_9EURO|nr:hypothetical protein EYZ11_006898 [Aspergillus tanneri]
MKFSQLLPILGLLSRVDAAQNKRVLYPAHPPNHDADDLAHLVPTPEQAMHFREGGKSATDPSSFGHMVSTFNHPTVLLDHSSQIASVSCKPNGLDVCFKNEAAERHAAEKWDANHSPLIFSTNHPGCGNHHDGKRSFWKVSTVLFKAKQKCASVNATEVSMEEAMKDFDLEFGHTHEKIHKERLSRRSTSATLIASSTTEDITDDPAALSDFFGVPVTGTYENIPEATPESHDGTVTEITPKDLEKRLWGPIQWLADVGKAVVNTIVDGGKKIWDGVKELVGKVIEFGKEIGKLIQDPLNYEWSLGASVSRQWNIGGEGTRRVPTTSGLFGDGEGLVIASTGVFPGDLRCENCYAKGDVSFAGRIGWSINDGLKTGYISAGGYWDSQLALAFRLQGQKKVEAYKKQLLSKNLINLEIPGVISVGPEVTLSAVIDLYFQAQADILIGARFEISRGEARLDLLDKSKNKFEGFVPKLTPIAKYRGNEEASVTVDFGLPLGLEFGVDLLNGKWKKTVGIIDQPSFQVRAKTSVAGCDGIDMSLAVQNYLYLTALGLYDYAIDTRDLWSAPLGCIKVSPSSSKAHRRRLASRHLALRAATVEPAGEAVNETFPDGGISIQPPEIDPVSVNETEVDPVTDFGYKLISDIKQTAILIAGKEDRLYLAPYGDPDASGGAPFAYQEEASDSVIMGDVYGGYLNYNPTEMSQTGASNLRSSRLTNVPEGSKFIALAEVHTDGTEEQGMYVAVDGDKIYALATCSVVDMGTRMYVVDYTTNVMNRLNNNELKDSVVGGEVRGCQLVYLTSGSKGLVVPE